MSIKLLDVLRESSSSKTKFYNWPHIEDNPVKGSLKTVLTRKMGKLWKREIQNEEEDFYRGGVCCWSSE